MDSENTPSLRVLMLPWLAHGHISPFLQLAKLMARRNLHVYFCSTPVNLSFYENDLDDSILSRIELVELHLPHPPHLPPHFHTTRNLPNHLIPTLIEAFDAIQPSLSNLLTTLHPNIVIYDPSQSWVPLLSSRQKIPAIPFMPMGCAFFSYAYHLINPPENSSDYPFTSIKDGEFENCRGNQFPKRFTESTDRTTTVVAVKTCREIEGKFLDYFSLITGEEVLPVGLLAKQDNKKRDDGLCEVMEWLGKKERASVVYVSFGSEVVMSREEIQELGYGLELSGVGFIWVARFREDGKEVGVQEGLPSGFLERVGEKGMVMGWVEQEKVLEHSSVGGFLTHCGWGSVVEGLRLGVPLIALPLQYEQPVNANLVVRDLGVGVKVARESGGGGVSFKREKLAKGIRVVMVDKEGEGVRCKAKEMGERLRCKGEEEVDVFVEKIVEICKVGKGQVVE